MGNRLQNKTVMTSKSGAAALASKLLNGLAILFLAIFCLLPFHAFLTTWAGSTFGHLDVWRIWKELVIFAVSPVVVWVGLRNPDVRRWIRTDKLPQLVLGYIVLYLLLGLLALAAGRTDGDALVYGLFSSVRFIAFFMMVAVVAYFSPLLRRYIVRVLLASASVVLLFGVLQLTVLPHDVLTHFGYGPDTIPAIQTVDNKSDYQRIQSTLRGANPLGAYIVVIVAVLAAHWRRTLRPIVHGVFGIVALIVLFFTYSRSGYIGTVLAIAVVGCIAIRRTWRRRALTLGLTVVVVGAAAVFVLRDVGFVQNTVFHSDETSQSVTSSNASRLSALQSGVRDVAREPFGEGPGTAGPASVRNGKQPARIAENYYVQVGQEVGWLGLVSFATISVLVGLLLWRSRSDPLAVGLLAAFVGLTFVNMVSHAWADDTLGLLWWGAAGVIAGSGILHTDKIRKQHAKTQKST